MGLTLIHLLHSSADEIRKVSIHLLLLCQRPHIIHLSVQEGLVDMLLLCFCSHQWLISNCTSAATATTSS